MKNTIGLLLAKRAHLTPDLEALVDTASGRRMSCRALNAACNRTAHGFAKRGVGKGDRVALLTFNCPEFVESFFALAKLGAVVVPLNVRLVADELAHILKDSGARMLVYGEEFRETVAELHHRGRDGSAVSDWVQIVGEGGERDAFALSYRDLQAEGTAAEPEGGADEGDLLYVMYTSGTTGSPKGAVHTHDSAVWASLSIGMTAEMRFKDRYLLALPAYHVGALTPLTCNVHLGVTTVMMRSFDPLRAWQLIEEEAITVMLAVPAMLSFMARVPEIARVDRRQLRWIMCGAAPVPVTLIESYAEMGIEVHEVYGLTECCGPGCLIGPDDARVRRGSTGKPFFHTEVRVVDANGEDCPPDVAGEVVIRAKHVMKEYWNNPKATAAAIRDGWLHTGDIATIDKDGFVYIKDRLKDMLISGGENVYPAEVENVILSHPKVREVAVIGVPSARWGEAGLAVVAPAEAGLDREEIIAHCEGRLARYKLPKLVEFVDEIPRNPTGKVLKHRLRERFPGPAPE